MKSIKIDSKLTTDILLKDREGTWSANVYNEYAVFIAQVTLTDDVEKTHKYLRFETQQFVKDKVNIHQEWLSFDELIGKWCEAHKEAFTDFPIKPILINIPAIVIR